MWAVALGLHAPGPDAHAAAQPSWFTVSGDASRVGADTVQVDPLALKPDGDARTMPVRVSRSQERRNWDDVPYRSYESRVRIDCRTQKAHYLEATFYMEPLWRGHPHQVASYAQKPPAMLFRGMSPNPTERIIRAACRPTG
ncbi:MAG: hypothetical protein HOQ33_09265 [Cupriavidus sp.]|nr:hypothetical protein [Cupriavidus sp.]